MTREEIITKAKATLAEEFDIDENEIIDEANIKDALHLDSLSLVDLVAVVQYTYNIEIPVENLRKIETFTDLYDYIESHSK